METKTKILYEAVRLFMELGYEKASINNLVRRSGISKGGIYHHFKDKDDLFKETVLFFIENREDEEPPSNISLKDLIFLSFSNLTEIRKYMIAKFNIDESISTTLMIQLIVLAIRKFPDLKEKIRENLFARRDFIIQVIINSQLKGEIKPDIDPEILELEIWGLMEGLFILYILREDFDLDSTGKKIANNLWNRLKKRSSDD